MTEPKTPEQLRTRETVSRMFSIGFSLMFLATVTILWAALMYNFVKWAF